MADLQSELNELKRKVDDHATRLSQLEGKFGFIVDQLRDIQLYMHAKFEDVENRLGGIEGQLESMPSRIAKIVSDTLRD